MKFTQGLNCWLFPTIQIKLNFYSDRLLHHLKKISEQSLPKDKSILPDISWNCSWIKIRMLLQKVFHPIVDDLVVDIKMTSSVLICSIMKQTKLRMSIGNIAGTAERLKNLEGHNNNRIFIPVSGIFKSCQSLGGGGAVLPPYFLRSCFWMQQELHQCTGNPTDLGLLPSTSKKVARKKRTDCHSISRRSKGGSSHEMFVTWTLLRNSYINYFTFLLVQESKLPFCKEKRLKVHAP